jgi:hypothetical protein
MSVFFLRISESDHAEITDWRELKSGSSGQTTPALDGGRPAVSVAFQPVPMSTSDSELGHGGGD